MVEHSPQILASREKATTTTTTTTTTKEFTSQLATVAFLSNSAVLLTVLVLTVINNVV